MGQNKALGVNSINTFFTRADRDFTTAVVVLKAHAAPPLRNGAIMHKSHSWALAAGSAFISCSLASGWVCFFCPLRASRYICDPSHHCRPMSQNVNVADDDHGAPVSR